MTITLGPGFFAILNIIVVMFAMKLDNEGGGGNFPAPPIFTMGAVVASVCLWGGFFAGSCR